MIVFEVIGWSFVAGCSVAVFLAPIYLIHRIFPVPDAAKEGDRPRAPP